jgi:hypothetical protein
MSNPFLKNKKKARKYGESITRTPKDSIQVTKKGSKKETPKMKLTPKDETLMTLNSTEKNPIIFPSTLKQYVHKKKMLLSPVELSKLSFGKNRKVTSFDDRLKMEGNSEKTQFNFTGSLAYPKRGILRWDDYSFMNKDSIFKEELKNIKKELKKKKILKSIENYRKEIKKEVKSVCSIEKDSASTNDSSNTNRKDVFGNSIIKGGSKHRVCFSFHGDMKVVENWKELNKLNSIKPDKSLALEDDDEGKKKCNIF